MNINFRILIACLISIALVSNAALAQEATPASPTLEVMPTPELPAPVPTIEVPTVPPTVEALPTIIPPTATLALPAPTLRAETISAWVVGVTGDINIVLDTANSAPINSLDAQCSIAPYVSLASAQLIAGAFAPDAIIINGGVNVDGAWMFAVSQPSTPLMGGIVFRLTALGAASGVVGVNCVMTGIGMDGARLPLAFAPFTLTIGDAPTVVPSATLPPLETPTLEVPPEITPMLEVTSDPNVITEVAPAVTPTLEMTVDLSMTAEVTPEVTPPSDITPELTLTAEPTTTQEVFAAALPGSIVGQVALSDSVPSGVVVSLRSVDGTVVMLGSADDAGAFRLDAVIPGDYLVIAEAAGYLPIAVPLTLSEGGGASLGTLFLYAGDVVVSERAVIDELDVIQFSAWYGNPAAYDPRGDFNRDGQIDLLDLRAIAQNIRRAG